MRCAAHSRLEHRILVKFRACGEPVFGRSFGRACHSGEAAQRIRPALAEDLQRRTPEMHRAGSDPPCACVCPGVRNIWVFLLLGRRMAPPRGFSDEIRQHAFGRSLLRHLSCWAWFELCWTKFNEVLSGLVSRTNYVEDNLGQAVAYKQKASNVGGTGSICKTGGEMGVWETMGKAWKKTK